MTVDPETGTIRWTPTAHQVGVNSIVLQAQDVLGASAAQTFEIEVTCVNGSPMIHSVPLTEGVVDSPYFYALRASDPDGDSLSFRFGNQDSLPAGLSIDGNGLIRWIPTDTDEGNLDVVVVVEDSEGAFATQQFTIVVEPAVDGDGNANSNRAPLISSTPNFNADVDESYIYQIQATDPEGEALSYEFSSATTPPDGLSLSETGLVSWTPTLAQVGEHPIAILVRDASGAAASQAFTIDVRENLPPEIFSSPPLSVTAGATYRYSVRATDPEGGDLTFELVNAPDSMSVDQFGRIVWNTDAGSDQPVDVTLRVTDEGGKSVEQSWQIEFVADTESPLVSATVFVQGFGFQTASQVDIGSSNQIRVIASDNVAVASLGLKQNGVDVPLNDQGQFTFDAIGVGTFTFLATATDAAGNVGESTLTVRVVNPANPNTPIPTGSTTVPSDPTLPPHPGFDPSDNGAPNVEITAPAQLSSISNIVSIEGTVDDPEDNLWYYRVLAAPVEDVSLSRLDVSDPDWQILNESTEEVIDGQLAVFDPSTFENGAVAIAVAAFDVNGRGFVLPTVIYVEGNVQLGNFTLSFTDLSIPLAGIPIDITRVYDTVDANDEGDFGFGWRLGAQDANILEVAGIAPGGALNPGNNTFAPDLTKVYLTNPDGQRVGFTYREELISGGGFINFGNVLRPYFEADPGVYDTLTIDETRVSRGGILGALSQGINPDFYTLTTRDNLSYRYTDEGTLISINDLKRQRGHLQRRRRPAFVGGIHRLCSGSPRPHHVDRRPRGKQHHL